MISPHLSEEEKNRVATDSARTMVMDLVLRNLIHKLNSEKAIEGMKLQIIEQMEALRNYWHKKEMEIATEEGFPDGISPELFEHEIDQGFKRLIKIGHQIVDGIFSKPTDIAGQM